MPYVRLRVLKGGCASTSFNIPCLTASIRACGFADFLVRQSAKHHCVRICERSAIDPEHASFLNICNHVYCLLLLRKHVWCLQWSLSCLHLFSCEVHMNDLLYPLSNLSTFDMCHSISSMHTTLQLWWKEWFF